MSKVPFPNDPSGAFRCPDCRNVAGEEHAYGCPQRNSMTEREAEIVERCAELAHLEAVRLQKEAEKNDDPRLIHRSGGAQRVEGILRGAAAARRWP